MTDIKGKEKLRITKLILDFCPKVCHDHYVIEMR